MLSYFKFRQELFDPTAARDTYFTRKGGSGWPEHCPPIRAANAFGWDMLANFDITFIRQSKRDRPWRIERDVIIGSDFDWSPDEHEGVEHRSPSAPLTQQYAWFWQKGQTLPHPISDDVYEQIKHQVKVSTFLYMATEPNELLYMTEIPNMRRPFRAATTVVDIDWYPASYPWHCVLELDPKEKRIRIRKGEPLCRVFTVRRDTFFAQQMLPHKFSDFFTRGQQWLTTHGRKPADAPSGGDPHALDITHTYSKQQIKSRFIVLK